jgi:hypothetical protein
MRGISFSLRFIIGGVVLAGVGATMLGNKDMGSAGWRILIGGTIAALLGVFLLIRTMQDSGEKEQSEGAGPPDKHRE